MNRPPGTPSAPSLLRTLCRLLMVGLGAGLMQASCQHAPEMVGDGWQSGSQSAATLGINEPSHPTSRRESAREEKLKVLLQAERLLTNGKVEEAVALLEQEVSRAPDQLQPWLLMGGAFLELGKVGEAEQTLSRLVEKWPTSAAARLLMGHTLLQRGERMGAVEQFQRVLQLTDDDEESMSAHLGLASVYESLGDQQRADFHYGQALSVAPELRAALINIQKALLWREPTVTTEGNVGHSGPNRARRMRIEAELEKLREEKEK